MKKMSFWAKLLLPFLSVFFCIGTLEIAGRIWEYNLSQGASGWEVLGSRRIKVDFYENYFLVHPNQDFYWEGIKVHVNAQGLREDDRDYHKQPGTYRVVVLGDSVPFGWEVEQADTHARVLETLLRQDTTTQYDVVNMGSPGLNLGREYHFLKDTLSQYQPSLVVWDVTTWNDIDPRECAILNEKFDTSAVQWMRDNTALWPFLSALMGRLRSNSGEAPAAISGEGELTYPFPLDTHDSYWNECVHQPVQSMLDLLSEHQIPLLMVIFPIDMQVRRLDAATTPQDYFQQLTVEMPALKVLDLLPVFREAYAKNATTTESDSSNPLFGDYYSHPSAVGHQLAAEAIYRAVMDNHFVAES